MAAVKGDQEVFQLQAEGALQLRVSTEEGGPGPSEQLRWDDDPAHRCRGAPPEDIARGYRTLTQVGDAFDEIKNFIELRPIRHHPDPRVKAHVAICVIAYLIPESVTIASSMVSPGVFRKKSGVKSHIFAVISRTRKLLSVFLLF